VDSTKKYRIEVCWVDEEEGDGYYVAFHPAFGFSACAAPGDSVIEAIERLEEVRDFVILRYCEKGKMIPEPKPFDTETNS
jgi:predicted RNase H-like HicB family nuclease